MVLNLIYRKRKICWHIKIDSAELFFFFFLTFFHSLSQRWHRRHHQHHSIHFTNLIIDLNHVIREKFYFKVIRGNRFRYYNKIWAYVIAIIYSLCCANPEQRSVLKKIFNAFGIFFFCQLQRQGNRCFVVFIEVLFLYSLYCLRCICCVR